MAFIHNGCPRHPQRCHMTTVGKRPPVQFTLVPIQMIMHAACGHLRQPQHAAGSNLTYHMGITRCSMGTPCPESPTRPLFFLPHPTFIHCEHAQLHINSAWRGPCTARTTTRHALTITLLCKEELEPMLLFIAV
jgi:hypothetical protein